MKKYNLSKPEKYMSNGVEKTAWKIVGEMIEFEKQDGTISRIIDIPAIGLKANVFEQGSRNVNPSPVELKKTPEQVEIMDTSEKVVEYPEEEINPQNIPF